MFRSKFLLLSSWLKMDILLLSSGPKAYAPDALQPIDLLCNPSIFKRSHLCRQSAFWSVLPERPLAVKGGTTYVGEKHGQQFCLNARLPRNI